MTRPGRGGFTLLEMIAVLAIILALGTVLLTVTVGRVGEGRSAALAGTLSAASRGIGEFRGDVRRYPSSLRQLTTPLAVGAADLCGDAVPATLRARWRGPYLDRQVPAGGLPSGAALVENALERDPPAGGADDLGTLLVVVLEVDRAIAESLESTFDGDGDFTTGTIRWTETPGTGQGTLRYAQPIRGC